MSPRLLDGGDEPAIRAFRCAARRRRTPTYVADVQNFIRFDLFPWLRQTLSAEAWVIEHYGEIVAVCAFELEPPETDDSNEPATYYLPVLAVHADHQGGGFGRDLFAYVLTMLAQRSPGGTAHWKCDKANRAANRISEWVGASRDPVSPRDLHHYTLQFDPIFGGGE